MYAFIETKQVYIPYCSHYIYTSLSPREDDPKLNEAAEALLRAAEDGRLASALAPKELEQMRQEAADALLRAAKDGTLEKALLKAGWWSYGWFEAGERDGCMKSYDMNMFIWTDAFTDA